MLPREPAMLLSVVNTKLRDEYESLEELCAALDIKENDLTDILAGIGCRYDRERNRFG